MAYQGYPRSPLNLSRSVDYQAVKRNAFHNDRILVVSLDDPNIPWPEKEILKAVGERLYGKVKSKGD